MAKSWFGNTLQSIQTLFGKKLAKLTPNDQDAIIFDATSNSWIPSPVSGGGGVQTTSNTGLGEGLAKALVGTDAPFKSIIGELSRIIVTGNANDVTLTLGSDVPFLSISNTYISGARQIMKHGAVNAGFNLGENAGDPSTPIIGDYWFNATTDELKFRDLAITRLIAFANKNNNFSTPQTFLDYIQLQEVTPPATPPANNVRIFPIDDAGKSRLQLLTPDGSQIVLAQDNTYVARNNSGSTISKGKPVTITGAIAQHPTIALAKADSNTTLCYGFALDDISNNTNGRVIILGVIPDIDTSAFTDGDRLFLSAATAGALTTTAPTTIGQFEQRVAIVSNAHGTQGKLLVIIGYALEIKQNVASTSNTGTGAGIAKALVGTDAPFKSIIGELNKIIVTANANDLTFTIGSNVFTTTNRQTNIVNSEIDNAAAIALTKLANIATARILGRLTAGSGSIEELTAAQVTAFLNVFTTTLNGLVPAPTSVANKFLRDDGTWQTVGGSSPLTTKGDIFARSTVDARLPVGLNGQKIIADSAQTLGLKYSYEPIVTKTTTYTLTIDDEIVEADATSAAFTLTLPTAVGFTGKQFTIKKIDSSLANRVTINTTSAQTIDGLASGAILLTEKGESITVVSDGANWVIRNRSRYSLFAYRLKGSTINRNHSTPSTLTALATATIVANTLYAMPFVVEDLVTIDQLLANVTTAGAGSSIRMGIYSDNGNLYPDALIVDGGSISSATTGVKTATVNVTLGKGLYWLVIVCNATAPVIRGFALASLINVLGLDSGLGTAQGFGWSVTFTFAALPSTFTAGGTVRTAIPAPYIGVRFAS